MQDYRLTPQELGELRAAHRRVRDAREAWLYAKQLQELDQHLQGTLYLTAAAVASSVQERRGVYDTHSGMTALLHRLNDVYKKATLEPGQHPAPEEQQAFVAKYAKLKADKAQDEVIYFVDAVPSATQPHPRLWLDQTRSRSRPSRAILVVSV